MDAIEYLTQKKRMCECLEDCALCKFYNLGTCDDTDQYKPQEAVKIVQSWDENNPKKDNVNEALKLIQDCPPGVKINFSGEYVTGNVEQFEALEKMNITNINVHFQGPGKRKLILDRIMKMDVQESEKNEKD